MRIKVISRGYAHEILELTHLDGEDATFEETKAYFESHERLQQFGSWVIPPNRIHFCTD